MKRACFADTEAEANAIAEVLRDHNIEAQLIPFGGPYPSLAGGRWGEIRVPEDRLQEAHELIAAWRKAPPPPPEPEPALSEPDSPQKAPPAKASAIPWLLLLLSVALNFALLSRSPANNRLEKSGVVEVLDDEGRVVQREYYRPEASKPHRLDSLDRSGTILGSWYDRDENGLYERVETYEMPGRKIESFDADEDGIFEHGIRFSSGRKISEYRIDRDGTALESAKLGTVQVTVEDRDGDGFYEQVRCAPGNAAERALNLAACE